MKLLLLLILSLGSLGAQVTVTASEDLSTYDASSIVWWVNFNANFLEEADTNQNGVASPIEVREWVKAKMIAELNNLVRRAKEDREKQDAAALEAEYQQALANLAAAQAAVDAFRNRQ